MIKKIAFVFIFLSLTACETVKEKTSNIKIPKGDAWVGAADVWHNASNRTDQPVAVFVVFMGANGLENTIRR